MADYPRLLIYPAGLQRASCHVRPHDRLPDFSSPSFVLAISIYILTIQKKSIFGVLKAEGVPNRYISRSVKTQIVILVSSGMALGLAFTLLTGLGLAGKVPFMVQPLFFLGHHRALPFSRPSVASCQSGSSRSTQWRLSADMAKTA